MRVTAICNLKGGVGKSTTAINLAAILARRYQKRVLLIDADSQCNTTEFFGGFPALGSVSKLLRVADLQEETDLDQWTLQQVQTTRYDNIWLVAADDSLMDLDLSKAESGEASTGILRRLTAAAKDSYDVVLIDCPPAFNAASAAALVAADDVIIPIKLDAFSLRGMGNMMCQIANMRKLNPKIEIAGVLPTMWYADPVIQRSEAQLAEAGLKIYPHIRASRPVDAMTYKQQPLCVSSPRSGAGRDYQLFADAYIQEGKRYGL